jgi:hypothetical protein
MKGTLVALLGLALTQLANAHYIFGRLILDGKKTQTWEYVREITPRGQVYDEEIAWVHPLTDPDSLDVRCGRNASTSSHPVKTATIHAGDRIGFAAGERTIQEADAASMYHPGFASAWLSKAPNDDLDAYTGDGDWVKIMTVTGQEEQSHDWTSPEWAPKYDMFKSPWGTYLADSWNFTIPATTPPGKYLLRFEHIFPNAVDAQFYVNCAHVEVLNDGAVGTPGPLVNIPGVYKRGQSDVYFSVYDYLLSHNLDVSGFVPPAPVVWRG